MTPNPEDFARLVREWQGGSDDALAALFAGFSGPIRVAVRLRLHDKLRSEYDSLDFVQDVWASVAALTADRRTFASPEALVAFLTRVAANKVIDATRRRFTAARCVDREQPMPAAVSARQPSPSEWAIGREQWDRIVGQFPPGHRAVLERLREGYTQQEIAHMTGTPLRSVERIVRRLKDLCGV